ncbi:hypothetical protein O988_02811 [Pseudogymnoascus sp. VKM F-3808]|nr:hypothetical protein O988_02811 [Pseudogymnoascus sp. VKM F-3808]
MEDTMMGDGMQTPTMKSVNVADAFDWHKRANAAEHELMIQKSKLAREKRTNRRLQYQVNSNIEGWTVTSQHMQLLASSNHGYYQEILRLKSKIEALEAVIQKLFSASRSTDNK